MGKESFRDSNLSAVGETIRHLRDIRRAVTKPEKKPLREVFRRTTRYAPESLDRQSLLVEAEMLAIAGGDYLAAFAGKNQEHFFREKWFDTVSDFARVYGNLNPLSVNEVPLTESSYWVLDHAFNLALDPNYLTWELLIHNNMGDSSDVKDLLDKNTGVVAPLSSDYLIAAIFRGYLEQNEGRAFRLHPMAIAVNGGISVLADRTLDLPEVAIYIDAIGNGQTAEIAYGLLQRIFPDKTIHKPNMLLADDIVPTFGWKAIPREGELTK
jgi:hypothetical protein